MVARPCADRRLRTATSAAEARAAPPKRRRPGARDRAVLANAEAMIAAPEARDREAAARALRAARPSARRGCSSSWSCSSRNSRPRRPKTSSRPRRRQQAPATSAAVERRRAGAQAVPGASAARARGRRRRRPAARAAARAGSSKLGEDITETLEVIPRQWKVIQTVREKFTCRDCERISQPPAPFHADRRAAGPGPNLLAMILFEKFGQHQPLNRQGERYAREGVDLSLSTLADLVGACTAALAPLHALIAHARAGGRAPARRRHPGAGARQGQDRSPAGSGSMSATTAPSRRRAARRAVLLLRATAAESIPTRHLAGWQGHPAGRRLCRLQRPLPGRPRPGAGDQALCWAMAGASSSSSPTSPATPARASRRHAISPVALEAVGRIDALFDIERGHQRPDRRARGWRPGSERRARWSPSSNAGCARERARLSRTIPSPRRWTTC